MSNSEYLRTRRPGATFLPCLLELGVLLFCESATLGLYTEGTTSASERHDDLKALAYV
jgi:hypothetical protein